MKSAAKSLPATATRRAPAHGSSTRSGGSVAASLAKLQANGGNHAVNAMLGGGVPLSCETRDEFERRFGADFSDVRIHNDGAAHESAVAMHANAYTFGSDIVFGANRFAPQSPTGKHLLAHEIAHVVQQRRGGAAPALSSNAAHEHGADAAASAFFGPGSVAVQGATGVGVARQAVADAVDPDVEARTNATGRPFSNAEYEKRKAELKKTMSSLAGRGIDDAQNGRDLQQDHMENVRGVAGTLSAWWNDVRPPYIGIWSNARELLLRAQALLAADDLRGAHTYLVNGYESLTDARQQWSQFMTATIEGAQTTITTLTVIRDGAIALEVGLLTGGSGLVGGGVVGSTLAGVGAATHVASKMESPLGEATRGTLAEIRNTGVMGNLRLAANGVAGILYGTGEGLTGIVKSFANMFLHPIQFVDDLLKLPSALDALWAHRQELWDHFASLPPEQQAFEVGRLAGQIEAMLIAAEATKAGGAALSEGMTFTVKVPQWVTELAEVAAPALVWVDRTVTISTAAAVPALNAAAAVSMTGNLATMAQAAKPKAAAKGGGSGGSGGGKGPKKSPTKKAPPEQLTPGKSQLNEFDIDRYGVISQGEFRAGDGLAGHEMLQNAWLKIKGFTPKRAAGVPSRWNPSVALSKEMHDAVSLQQKALGLHDATYLNKLSAVEVIELNAQAMRRAGVPEPVIQILQREALQHAASLPH